MEQKGKSIDANTLKTLKHDIKNQLSNINMVVAQLKYEMQGAAPDVLDDLEILTISAARIDTLLKGLD